MEQLKEQFLLDPNIIYLNHGSFGACPKPVFEVYQAWQYELEHQPVKFLGREFNVLMQNARHALGEYLNTLPENLVYIPNATFGVNIIARSLPLKPGDEILSTDHEYGACDYAWEFICKKTGASYIRQPISLPIEDQGKIIEQIWDGVTPNTKLIYLSHITSPTAIRLPVEDICWRARQAGILTLVDGAHAPGQISLNLEDLDADFYTGNCHKWMLSPKGAGFLFARPEVQLLIEPLVISWGYRANKDFTTGTQFIDYLQWSGTHDPAAAFSVPSAIHFMQAYDWEKLRLECHELLKQALQRICTMTRLPPVYPLNSDLYVQMGTALLPQVVDLNGLKKRIYDEFHIEIPLIQWNDWQLIRISIQAYNTQSDVDCLLSALEECLADRKYVR